MTSTDSDGPREPGRVAKAVSGIAILAVLKRMADREAGSPVPKVSIFTKRTAPIRKVAFRLGEEGREDPGAVGELKQVAGGRSRELRRAETSIRADGGYLEDVTCDRAVRLLQAAATDRPVEPLSDERMEWFEGLRALRDQSIEDGYSLLAALEPQLASFSREIEAAARDRGPDDGDYEVRINGHVYDRCTDLVGLESHSTEPLIRTMLAKGIALDHLRSVAGLPDFGEEADE